MVGSGKLEVDILNCAFFVLTNECGKAEKGGLDCIVVNMKYEEEIKISNIRKRVKISNVTKGNLILSELIKNI